MVLLLPAAYPRYPPPTNQPANFTTPSAACQPFSRTRRHPPPPDRPSFSLVVYATVVFWRPQRLVTAPEHPYNNKRACLLLHFFNINNLVNFGPISSDYIAVVVCLLSSCSQPCAEGGARVLGLFDHPGEAHAAIRVFPASPTPYRSGTQTP